MTDQIQLGADQLEKELLDRSSSRRAHLLRPEWWNEQLLEWSMSHPSFKTQLFRFVDVFPATGDDDDVLRHLEEYFDLAELPRIVDLGLELAGELLGGAISAAVARRSISRMAQQFIVGRDAHEAVEKLEAMWVANTASTVDVLGEKTVTTTDAERYLACVDDLLTTLLASSAHWVTRAGLDSDDLGPIPRVNISIKPTALSTHYLPLSSDEGLAEALARLRPVLEKALAGNALIHIDMEHFEVKDLTLELVAALLADPDFTDLHIGVTVQSYLRDSAEDLERLIELSGKRSTPHGTARQGCLLGYRDHPFGRGGLADPGVH